MIMKLTNLKSETLINPLSLFFVVVLLLSGCAVKVKLVGQYDDIVDKSVHQLQSRTTAHIKQIMDNGGQGEGSYDNSKQFYSDARGEVQALVIRSEALEEGLKKTPLTDNFEALVEQYDDLETLHQTPYSRDVMKKAQEAFDQSYRAIVKHLVYLKWNQEQPDGKE